MDILKQELASRQRRNESYSLRSFSRDLAIPLGTLSRVLADKRSLPRKYVDGLASSLCLSPKQKSLFLNSSRSKGDHTDTDRDQLTIAECDRGFFIISEWEHFAVLSLMDIKGFRPKVGWIAERLCQTHKNRGLL